MKRINTLQALLEYAHSLPWGRARNGIAHGHLGATLEIISEDIAELGEDAEDAKNVAPDNNASGVGQK